MCAVKAFGASHRNRNLFFIEILNTTSMLVCAKTFGKQDSKRHRSVIKR